MRVDFKFEPRQPVTIVAYGLLYQGRVTRCTVYSGPTVFYGVEYARDGQIENREFSEDELTPRI